MSDKTVVKSIPVVRVVGLSAQGVQGVPGAQGSQGAQGAASTVAGPQGYQGAVGAQGSQGATGADSTVQGPQGDTGPGYLTTGTGTVNFGDPLDVVAFTVDAGLAYRTGDLVRAVYGTDLTGPLHYTGYVASYSGTTLTLNRVSSRGSGVQTNWTFGLVGDQGVAGYQGYQGAVGAQGFQGATGADGAQGFQGDAGVDGAQGYQGFQGAAGSQGNQGYQGAQGTQGSQGSQGTQGNQGAAGSQGNQGYQGAQGNQGTQGNQGAFSFTMARGKDGTYEYPTVPGVVLGNFAANQANAASTVHYEPWVVISQITLKKLYIYVGSAATAGGKVRLAIYEANADWQPTNLVLDAGELTVDSTGKKSITGLSTVLAPGRYLARLHADASGTQAQMWCFYGSPFTGSLLTESFSGWFHYRWTASLTYGTAESNGTDWSGENAAGIPMLYRIIAVVTT